MVKNERFPFVNAGSASAILQLRWEAGKGTTEEGKRRNQPSEPCASFCSTSVEMRPRHAPVARADADADAAAVHRILPVGR